MTDLEKIELAIRKVASRTENARAPIESIQFWLRRVADQIADDERERRRVQERVDEVKAADERERTKQDPYDVNPGGQYQP